MLNQTEETIDKLYRQLFVVQPLNLCFPFEPDKLIPCPVQLTNNAYHNIAYRIQPNTPDIFVGSLNGTVPARSTQTYILTMQKQQKPPPNLSTIHIQSNAANLDFWLNFDYMFNKAEAVHDVLKQVKITSLHECASQQAFKVLSLNHTYRIDIHPLEPWVLIVSGEHEARGIEIWNCRTRDRSSFAFTFYSGSNSSGSTNSKPINKEEEPSKFGFLDFTHSYKVGRYTVIRRRRRPRSRHARARRQEVRDGVVAADPRPFLSVVNKKQWGRTRVDLAVAGDGRGVAEKGARLQPWGSSRRRPWWISRRRPWGEEEELVPPSMVDLATGGDGRGAAEKGARLRPWGSSRCRPWWISRRRPWGRKSSSCRRPWWSSRRPMLGRKRSSRRRPWGEEEELALPSLVELAPPAIGRKRSLRRYPWGRGRGARARHPWWISRRRPW
ncbi:unnamed protein product [Miscanthus lutarioriparius]|uniref:Uncharacterized protein n=1 Tax=Miscanthus lutarioriparius TaxID=422564 RepID=A0A811QKP7_9POAL|nr:unnamed protein product [Miscanthus lutarioriparius]